MILQLICVSKIYGKDSAEVKALDEVSLDIPKGSMYAIMGKSGCGKSTLLNIIAGLTDMTCGELLFEGEPINFKSKKELSNYRYKNIGVIVQNFALINNKTVFQNIALPLMNMTAKEIKSSVTEIAKSFGIDKKLHRYPFELSGGECQRVSIARAMINSPKIILADEPTGSLDTENEEIIIGILRQCAMRGTTVVIVTHDITVASRCDLTINMRDGKIVDGFKI